MTNHELTSEDDPIVSRQGPTLYGGRATGDKISDAIEKVLCAVWGVGPGEVGFVLTVQGPDGSGHTHASGAVCTDATEQLILSNLSRAGVRAALEETLEHINERHSESSEAEVAELFDKFKSAFAAKLKEHGIEQDIEFYEFDGKHGVLGSRATADELPKVMAALTETMDEFPEIGGLLQVGRGEEDDETESE